MTILPGVSRLGSDCRAGRAVLSQRYADARANPTRLNTAGQVNQNQTPSTVAAAHQLGVHGHQVVHLGAKGGESALLVSGLETNGASIFMLHSKQPACTTRGCAP